MNKRKKQKKIVLIEAERIEIFDPNNGTWNKVTNILYIPLIITTITSENNGQIINKLSFSLPYSNEPIPSYEIETYVIDTEGKINYIKEKNEEYESSQYRIRYNNNNVQTLKKVRDEEYTLTGVAKVRNKIITLANRTTQTRKK